MRLIDLSDVSQLAHVRYIYLAIIQEEDTKRRHMDTSIEMGDSGEGGKWRGTLLISNRYAHDKP